VLIFANFIANIVQVSLTPYTAFPHRTMAIFVCPWPRPCAGTAAWN
jgi:hypothetical protein